MSIVRVHNFSVSLDGFATGEGQSLEAPFGHADGRLLEWALAQFYKTPASSAFVVVFYGTLAHSGNEGLDFPAGPRIAGDPWQSY